jgi:hypothetical protein
LMVSHPSRKSIHGQIRSRKAQSSTNSKSSANSSHRYTPFTCLLFDLLTLTPTLSLTPTRLASSFVCLIFGLMLPCVIHRIFNSPSLLSRELSVTRRYQDGSIRIEPAHTKTPPGSGNSSMIVPLLARSPHLLFF